MFAPLLKHVSPIELVYIWVMGGEAGRIPFRYARSERFLILLYSNKL